MRRSIISLCLLLFAGTTLSCDDRAAPARPQDSAPSTMQAGRRIPLLAVPLTAEVPPGWDVRNGTAGRPLLNGPGPGGEVNVRLTARPPVRADGVGALLDSLAVVPGSPRTLAVADRDGMKVIEQFERLGAAELPADKCPVRWSFQYVLLGDGLDHPIYELDVADWTLLDYERSVGILRPIFESVRPAAKP